MGRNPDKCIHDVSLPRWEALAGILSRCCFHPETEEVPLDEAYGRVLARDLTALQNLPNHLAANRDGVAVYYADFAEGMPDTAGWREGNEYVYSNTGIGIPGDYDTEILIEQVEFDDEDRIRFLRAPAFRGENTIPPGKEIRAGMLLAKKGTEITPYVCAVLAKGGYGSVPVVRKPVVSFLPTGNELVPAGEPLPPRKNVDANSVLIRGKLAAWGAEPKIYPITPDDRDALRRNLSDAIATSDIVLINAGSSKGTDDFAHEVLRELGTMLNQQVDTGPGKHTSYTVADGVPVIGLSGPTGCTDCTSEWYVRPVIDLFLGREQIRFPMIRARSLTALRKNDRPMTFMLGAHLFMDGNQEFWVMPAANLRREEKWDGGVNCFIPLTPGLDIEEGGSVDVELRMPFSMPETEPDLLKTGYRTPVIR